MSARRTSLGVALAATVLTSISVARADEPKAPVSADRPAAEIAPRRPAPRNAFSLHVLSLLNSGVALQYERLVAPPRFSLAGSLGYRGSGGSDFDVVEGTAGTEGRYWLWGKDGFSRFDERGMLGPFIGFRFDFGYTNVSQGERSVGESLRFAEAVQLGARVAIAHRIEITPSVGMGLRHEVDPSGRLAAWTRFELIRFGLTAGVLF